jgi:hypothetical protein
VTSEAPRLALGWLVVLVLAEFFTHCRRAPAGGCPPNELALCRRIETGEAPGAVYNSVDPEAILVRLRACTACGSFPRIDKRVIPAGERLAKTFRDFRASQPRSADCSDEQKRTCDRVEAGEPAPKVLGMDDRAALALRLRDCRRCGGYPRIEVIIANLEKQPAR